MSIDTRYNLTPQLVVGVCLVLFGSLLTLDRMGLFEAAASLRLWPIILIAFGLWRVIERRESGRTLSGYVLAFVGSLLLLNNWGLLRVRFWELIWPAIIVFFGIRLIMQRPGRPRDPSRTGPNAFMPVSADGSGTISMLSFFGANKRTCNDKPFRGGEMSSIVGGTQLDLRQATIEPGQQAVIEILSILGGHELWVPSGWVVVNNVVPVLGGVEDKRLPPVDADAQLPTDARPRLVLTGFVVLGGLIIKN